MLSLTCTILLWRTKTKAFMQRYAHYHNNRAFMYLSVQKEFVNQVFIPSKRVISCQVHHLWQSYYTHITTPSWIKIDMSSIQLSTAWKRVLLHIIQTAPQDAYMHVQNIQLFSFTFSTVKMLLGLSYSLFSLLVHVHLCDKKKCMSRTISWRKSYSPNVLHTSV